MLTTSDHKHWHAVYVRHNTEFKVETWLREQGVEVYLPVQDVFREYAGKRVKVTKPVITGRLLRELWLLWQKEVCRGYEAKW